MNDLAIPTERYAGAVSAFARYRPAGVGALAFVPSDIGIACYNGLELESLRGLDAHRAAATELRARLTELDAEAAGQPFNEAQRAEFEEIAAPDTGLMARVDSAIEELEIRDARIKALVQQDAGAVEKPGSAFAPFNVRKAPENVYDLAAYRQRASSVDELPGLYRDGAMRVLDRASFPTTADQDVARGHVEQLLAKHKDDGNGVLARRMIATDDPIYREAIAEYMAGGRENVTSHRLAVLQTGSDADGGFAIPFTIDPTFIITTDGAASSLREFSRVETITTKSWHPLTTEDNAASYGTETAATTDSAPDDIDDVNGVTPLRAKRFVKFTAEFQEDYGPAAILAQVGVLIRDSKDLLEANKFVQGTGTNEPEGIIWKLDDDGSSVVSVATFDLDALDSLTAALGARFRNGGAAAYMANLAILQKIRQLGTAGAPANSIYDQISGILNGYRARELSFMDDAFANSGDEVLLFGNFKVGFVIVDRLGLSVEYVPQVFDGSGDPLGQRGIYARWRNTSKVITVNAFRLLAKT